MSAWSVLLYESTVAHRTRIVSVAFRWADLRNGVSLVPARHLIR